MTIPSIYDAVEAGFAVFPLWSITPQGGCSCDIYMPSASGEKCVDIGKHPRFTNWQHTQPPSDEHLEVVEALSDTGYGVLTRGLLVVDVDARNGGLESLAKLNQMLGYDIKEKSGFVVSTGSGGGSCHIYFRLPDETKSLAAHVKEIKGIDFKSGTGSFVVGVGSIHKSGNPYDVEKGSPQDADHAPAELLKLLEKPAHIRSTFNGKTIDVSIDDLNDVLAHIPNADLDYDDWISVGFAIHHCTGGAGYQLWERWSEQSQKFNPEKMSQKWHSFGKSSSAVTFGTLVYMARANGYEFKQSVTFDPGDHSAREDWVAQRKAGELPFDARKYDLLRPPGFIGELVDWANKNHRDEPLQRLNVAAMLCAVGAGIGLHVRSDSPQKDTLNLMVCCIAGSATGKETVVTNYFEVLSAMGMAPTFQNDIKSKQEMMRNLISHQASNYSIDEFGELLQAISNAKGTAYLEQIPGLMMAISTKGNKFFKPSGDVAKELCKDYQREIKDCEAAISRNEDKSGRYAKRAESLKIMLSDMMGGGLRNPFLSLIGYSVPRSVESIMTPRHAESGLLGRMLMPREENTNPRPIRGFTGAKPLPDALRNRLIFMSLKGATGEASMLDSRFDRIEYYGEPKWVQSTPEALEALSELAFWQADYAESMKQHGMEPLVRRMLPHIDKISGIIGHCEGARTLEHVEWAAAFVANDMARKVRAVVAVIAAESKDTQQDEALDAIRGVVLNKCDQEHGESFKALKRAVARNAKFPDDASFQAFIDSMVEAGDLRTIKYKPKNNPEQVRYVKV